MTDLNIVAVGGGCPGGREHHRGGDVSSAALSLTVHPVLRVQALAQEKREEKEEKANKRDKGNRSGSVTSSLNYRSYVQYCISCSPPSAVL